MRMAASRRRTVFTFAAILILLSSPIRAERILVAVAANFMGPMEQIVPLFEASTGHEVVMTSASSGKLYAQVRHGAPFQVFLSADDDKAQALIDAGLGLPESRYTYALGRLVLWSADPSLVNGPEVLRNLGPGRIAISNPRLAPYGAAAIEVLEELGSWPDVAGQVVQGENIAQTFNFVRSGNAPVGLVAASQIIGQGGSAWRVPANLHRAIRQDAIVLERGRHTLAAQDLMSFLRSAQAKAIIADFGYDLPDED